MASPESVQLQMGFPNIERCRHLAINAINKSQGERPADQLVGTAIALVAMCEAANVRIRDVLYIAENAMSDAEGPFTHQIQALRDYARAELRKDT